MGPSPAATSPGGSGSPSRPYRPSFASLKSTAMSCRCAKSRAGAGLPPATLRINPEGGYAVGIHVTPLGINAALINLSGDVIESTHREAPNATPDHAFELIGAMVLELTGLRPGGRVLGHRHGPARPVRRGIHELCRPDDHDRLEGCGAARSGWRLDRTAGLLRNRHGGGRHGRAPLWPRRADFPNTTTSISVSALAASWCMTAACCAAPGAMPARSGTFLPFPAASLPLRQSRLPRKIPLARGARRAPNITRADWVAEVGADLPQRHRHHREPVRPRNRHPRRACVHRPARTAGRFDGAACTTPSRRGGTARRPRVMVARGGQHSVLRGAAALAVSGVLSPRFGQMFTAERERRPRPSAQPREMAA